MTEVALVAVLALRLLVPLGIPKYPLPFVVAALLIDAADQTIFEAVGATSILDEYQGYDKALDVYYLTIAYASVLRNWLDPLALGIARMLFYYRLVGTLAFELTGIRALLVVFPNTFEYFFIFYETVRLFWSPARMSRRFLIAAAATIWVAVKLPQEYWIHVAQLDGTDELAGRPWTLPILASVGTLLLAVAWRQRARLPPVDRAPTVDVDAHIDRPRPAAVPPRRDLDAVFSVAVLEKVLLITTVVVIFSQILVVRANTAQMCVGVAAVVVLNSAISLWRMESGSRYGSTVAQFLAMAVVNGGVVAAGVLLRRTVGIESYLRVPDALFYLLLVTLIITMYDRYRVIRNLSRDRGARRRRGLTPRRKLSAGSR